ncbi:MAG: sigma-70 family RNA polymerase sigma factor [Actinomycetota bacterium]
MATLGGDAEGPEDYLHKYLEEVDGYPRLAEKDQRDLLHVVWEGSVGAASAKRRVIQTNLRLVVELARRYESTGRHLLDLIQEGNLGLIRAVEGFDPGSEHKFETFARWAIREAIASALRSRGQ